HAVAGVEHRAPGELGAHAAREGVHEQLVGRPVDPVVGGGGRRRRQRPVRAGESHATPNAPSSWAFLAARQAMSCTTSTVTDSSWVPGWTGTATAARSASAWYGLGGSPPPTSTI